MPLIPSVHHISVMSVEIVSHGPLAKLDPVNAQLLRCVPCTVVSRTVAGHIDDVNISTTSTKLTLNLFSTIPSPTARGSSVEPWVQHRWASSHLREDLAAEVSCVHVNAPPERTYPGRRVPREYLSTALNTSQSPLIRLSRRGPVCACASRWPPPSRRRPPWMWIRLVRRPLYSG